MAQSDQLACGPGWIQLLEVQPGQQVSRQLPEPELFKAGDRLQPLVRIRLLLRRTVAEQSQKLPVAGLLNDVGGAP